MYRPHTCCLLLFFLSSLFYHFPCATSKQELGCEALFQCGNITADFPFWGGNRPEPCGHAPLELRCNRKNITSLNISNHEYNVLHIDQTSNTLRLARVDLLGSFCSATFNTTTLPPEIFELSPTFKNLTIFYLCNPHLHYFSSYTCPGRGLVSAYQNPKYHSSCKESFTVNVPTPFFLYENELDLTHLESVLRKGFEVKVKIGEIPCEECSSSTFEPHRRCTQPFICGDQGGLLYPFWIPGREDCGHPDFKLECSKSFAELSDSFANSRILDANYHSRITKLAVSDYISNLCLKNPLNAPFNQSVLPFAPDTELLTIYYDCQDLTNISTYVNVKKLVCEDGSKAVRNYYVTRNISSPLLDGNNGITFDYLRESCTRDISIPVSRSAFNTLRPDNLTKVLEQGFELGLNPDCSMCIESKGACGYNQTSRGFVCYCSDGTHGYTCGSGKRSHASLVKLIIIVTGSVIGLVLFLLLLSLLLIFLRKRETRLRQQNLKALIPLKHYTYAQVKRITKSFAEVVGRGGFGIVYRGTLSDGCMVAVKVLKDEKGNGEDFINEVASMSQTSHHNIVSLLGFCSEGSKRAIIYEFLDNGSLDKFISCKTAMNMDWTTLYNIALGVARGLEYLHHGCKTRIVHFDIKPQNVLLDEIFCPKVSDFGLAKLCGKKESVLSLLDTRGTIGYIAPEMISRVYGSVSHKSDVYSYGMLVLEMTGARNKERAHQESASNPSSMYFPEWVYRDLEKQESGRFIGNGISSEEDEIAKKMALVGLWCIQSSPLDRPPMNRVVEMMEGSLEALEMPPRPVLQEIPTVPLQESSTLSEDISV